jgi:hypothetical protein
MKTCATYTVFFLSTTLLCLPAYSQGLVALNESGTSLLAPSIAPTGGFGAAPQEYLIVNWSVIETSPDIYTYSYSILNPAGDVLLTPSGGLSSTPEIYDAFSVGFNTTLTGAYITGTQSGGAFQEVNNIDLSWFFSPSVAAGTTGPKVSFESTFLPTFGNGNAEDAVPPSPWSTANPGGQQIPVPNSPNIPNAAAPEPGIPALLALSGLGFGCFHARTRRQGC